MERELTEELIVYRGIAKDPLLLSLADVMEHYREGRPETRTLFYDSIYRLIDQAGQYGFCGNLWHCHLAHLLVNDENCYSLGSERRGALQGTIRSAILHDAVILKELFDLDLRKAAEYLDVPEYALTEDFQGEHCFGRAYNRRISGEICALGKALGEASDGAMVAQILDDFYGRYGVGKYGLHKSFRILEGSGETPEQKADIIPIRNIAHIRLEDLVGYEIAKQKLIDNTEAFVSGRQANNCLLYGDAGTGKSSCIKAIANAYFDRGLRIIEVYKHQFRALNDVIGQIKNRNYRFIIYMDDLSFEDFETEYKYLKAVIEGGLERKPENVLIYATSNRRHLIRENYSDREEIREDMHTGDTVQEKLSLVSRFGVTIYFGAPDKKLYEKIVEELALRSGLCIPREELLRRANQWGLYHGGLSGRTAQQFIDMLLGDPENLAGDESV